MCLSLCFIGFFLYYLKRGLDYFFNYLLPKGKEKKKIEDQRVNSIRLDFNFYIYFIKELNLKELMELQSLTKENSRLDKLINNENIKDPKK